jgi:putative transcriptional regulator
MDLGAKEDHSKMIRELRAELGLTQEQFAAVLGVTYSSVNRWENNKVRPSHLALQRIKELQNKIMQKTEHENGK